MFPNLKSARFSASGADLQQICFKLTDRTEIEVAVQSSSASTLRSFGAFHNFQKLVLVFENPTVCLVKGSDLLLLAERCPGVQKLFIEIINDAEWGFPVAEGITDHVVDQLAWRPSLLRSLMFMDLIDINLTEDSLFPLG